MVWSYKFIDLDAKSKDDCLCEIIIARRDLYDVRANTVYEDSFAFVSGLLQTYLKQNKT